jgi:DNA mismatch endonuclease (patch repair protein)
VRPDYVFKEARTVIFVDGCFWHGCPKHATQPKNTATFWLAKRPAVCVRRIEQVLEC